MKLSGNTFKMEIINGRRARIRHGFANEHERLRHLHTRIYNTTKIRSV